MREKQKKSNEFFDFLQDMAGFNFLDFEITDVKPTDNEAFGDIYTLNNLQEKNYFELTSIFHGQDELVSQNAFNRKFEKELENLLSPFVQLESITLYVRILSPDGKISISESKRNELLIELASTIQKKYKEKSTFEFREYTIQLEISKSLNDYSAVKVKVFKPFTLERILLLMPPDNDLIFETEEQIVSHLNKITEIKSSQLGNAAINTRLLISTDAEYSRVWFIRDIFEALTNHYIQLFRFSNIYLSGYASTILENKAAERFLIDIKNRQAIIWDRDDNADPILRDKINF